MLASFKLPPDGYHYERTIQGFKRIFAATILFGTEDQPGGSVIDWARFHFFDEMHLWFNSQMGGTSISRESSENAIKLSEAFYREIDQHRIPVEGEVVAALAHAQVFSTSICGLYGKAESSASRLCSYPDWAGKLGSATWDERVFPGPLLPPKDPRLAFAKLRHSG